MKASVRATKTSQLFQIVAERKAQGWIAYCNGSWWRCRLAPSAPHTRWYPTSSADLLPFVQPWFQEQAAQFQDADYQQLADESANLRNFELFLRVVKTQLTVESLNG